MARWERQGHSDLLALATLKHIENGLNVPRRRVVWSYSPDEVRRPLRRNQRPHELHNVIAIARAHMGQLGPKAHELKRVHGVALSSVAGASTPSVAGASAGADFSIAASTRSSSWRASDVVGLRFGV